MMRYAKTLRCCCCNVDTAVIMLSTNREPAALCVPKLSLRAYSVNSVVLFVRVPDTASLRHNSDLPTIGVLCQLVVAKCYGETSHSHPGDARAWGSHTSAMTLMLESGPTHCIIEVFPVVCSEVCRDNRNGDHLYGNQSSHSLFA